MAAFAYKRPSEEALEKRASQRGNDFEGFIKDEYRTYQPKKQNAVRILPRDMREEDAKTYADEIHVHYGIGPQKASVLCPLKMASMPCPVCEERARAEKREDKEAMNDLRPVRRAIAWVIDKKQEDVGPLLWAMPWTVDRDIAKVSRDPQTGGRFYIDDPEQGYDVYFDVDGEGMTKKYVGFQIARRPTSVDHKTLEFIANNLLSNVLLFRGYEEIKVLFEGAPMPPAEQEHRQEPVETRAQETKAADPPPKSEPEPEPADEPKPAPSPAPVKEPEPVATVVSGATRAQALRERFANRASS